MRFNTEEAIGVKSILAHNSRMQKNPQTKEDTFWIFMDFHHGVTRVQSPTCTPAWKFHQCVTNLEIVYMLLLFQIFCID